MELALPGLVLYVCLIIASLRSASTRRHRVGLDHNARVAVRLAQATRLSLVAFVVAAFFHPVAYHFYFYFLAGLAVAARRLLEKEPHKGTEG